jgi:hypothetical protein
VIRCTFGYELEGRIAGVKKRAETLSFCVIIGIECLGERDEKRLINRRLIRSYTIRNIRNP